MVKMTNLVEELPELSISEGGWWGGYLLPGGLLQLQVEGCPHPAGQPRQRLLVVPLQQQTTSPPVTPNKGTVSRDLWHPFCLLFKPNGPVIHFKNVFFHVVLTSKRYSHVQKKLHGVYIFVAFTGDFFSILKRPFTIFSTLFSFIILWRLRSFIDTADALSLTPHRHWHRRVFYDTEHCFVMTSGSLYRDSWSIKCTYMWGKVAILRL